MNTSNLYALLDSFDCSHAHCAILKVEKEIWTNGTAEVITKFLGLPMYYGKAEGCGSGGRKGDEMRQAHDGQEQAWRE